MSNLVKKNRVGIITFHRAINYGALLQTYALQVSVEKIGGECEVIDYHNKQIDRQYIKLSLSKAKGLKDFAKYILYSRTHNRKYEKFRSFASKYLHLSSMCRDHNDLSRISSRYDLLISGSDQIWNYGITDFDTAYFLSFLNDRVKKNAYAASFGISQIPEEVAQDYKNLLGEYNKITVRENQGAEIIRDLTGRDVEVALDPTLLLCMKEWNKIAAEKKEKDYILIYSFGLTPTMKSFAENLSKKTGCRIIFFPASSFVRNWIRAPFVMSASPEEFLGFFKNASYVVTNSFHGTVFSILYEKSFFLEKHKPRLMNRNSRFDSLLDLLLLHDREIVNGENKFIEKRIDYTRVTSALEQERMKSLAFLEKIVNFSY